MIYDLIVGVLGVPPVGWEFLPYIVAIFVFFFIFLFILKLFSIPLKRWRFM